MSKLIHAVKNGWLGRRPRLPTTTYYSNPDIQWPDRIRITIWCLGQPYYVLAPAVVASFSPCVPHGQRRRKKWEKKKHEAVKADRCYRSITSLGVAVAVAVAQRPIATRRRTRTGRPFVRWMMCGWSDRGYRNSSTCVHRHV